MDNYENTWGRFTWTPPSDNDLIHPHDRQEDMWKTVPGKIFYCSGINEEGYLLLHDAHQTYRVKPEVYYVVPTPSFTYSDTVRDKENSERIGTIRNIEWHGKYSKEYYNLTINGRDSTKRYFAEDLELVT